MASSEEEQFYGFEEDGEPPPVVPRDDVDSSEECTMVQTNRGGFKLVYKGFQFYKDKEVRNLIIAT